MGSMYLTMLKILYLNEESNIEHRVVKLEEDIPQQTIWIDIIEPNSKEEKYIEKILRIESPNKKEMEKHEVINPFFVDKDVNYMTATVLDRASREYPDSITVTFIIKDNYLITTRFQEIKSFEYF